jgi:hypothetical protein
VLAGAGIAAFHALLTWLGDGLHLVDLDSGLGTLLDGQPKRDSLVRDGQTLTTGERQLKVALSGDLTAPGRMAGPATPMVGLTAIHGPHTGETAFLPVGQPVRLGKSSQVALSLPREPTLAAEHVELTLEVPSGQRPRLHLRDLAGRGDVLVERKPIADSGTVRLGDVIQFGQPGRVGPTALFFHLDPRGLAW